jgi:hypothetical protein
LASGGNLAQTNKIDSTSFAPPVGGPKARLASKVLMVRPVAFGFNEETAANNAFQKKGGGAAQDGALQEFDGFVQLLRSCGIDVTVVEDTMEPHTPDSIFPNNWFSTHESGELVLYPMCATNRRRERKEAPLGAIRLCGENGGMKRLVDLTDWESRGRFLEGTGSMVLDRTNGVAFVCRSQRSDEEVLDAFCGELGYRYFYFDALDRARSPIYHTNVMMCMGDGFVVACLDSIADAGQREAFLRIVGKCGKEVVEISLDQMERFAGNMLQLRSSGGESLLVMSSTAKESLGGAQLATLQRHSKIAAPQIGTIETNGGGSARCMLAEMFF